MPFGIELLFDPITENFLRKIGNNLEKKGVPSLFSIPGGEPHVALAVFKNGNLPALRKILEKTAKKVPPFELRLSSAGSFPGKEGVLFLGPVVTERLLRLHKVVHQHLETLVRGSWDYYKPLWWVPHCTLALNLSEKQLNKGFNIIKKMNFGKVGRYNRLGLVEVTKSRPLEIRLLYTVRFSGKKK